MKFSVWNKIISFFTYEWQKKLISLIVAGLLWFYVNSLSYVEQTFSLPIQFKNLPEDLVIMDSSDTSATFVVKGKVERVRNINLSKNIKPVVYLDQASPGVNYYKIELIINDPQADLNITLLKEKVKVKIDREVSKSVFIQAVVNGKPRRGYLLEDTILEPNQVIIKGPAEIITQYNFLETVPLSVEGATNDIVEPIPINLPKLINTMDTNPLIIHAKIIKKDGRLEEKSGK